MTPFLSTALAVACAALIWALGALDRLIEVGSVAGFVVFAAGAFLGI
jgi:hypothetical protein